MNFNTLDDVIVAGKKVLLRIDVNASVFQGRIEDSPRFKAAAETIQELLKRRGKIVILAHQGRKGGKDYLPLMGHARILSSYVGSEISYVNDLFGLKALHAIENLVEGKALLLRNVRDYKDETDLGPGNRFKKFCRFFDYYVNDAFSVCHRNQGSLVIPPRYLPSFAGRNLERELDALQLFDAGRGRSVFILGGSKVEDYFPLFSLLKKGNTMLASGVFGNLLLMIAGHKLGYEEKWLKDEGYTNLIPQLKRFYTKYKKQIILPVDFVLKNRRNATLEEAPFSMKIMDIGMNTLEIFKEELRGAKSVFMKGPLGFSEIPEFSYGTVEMLIAISQCSKKKKVFSLLGGGHLTTTLEKYKIPDYFSYTSLSGGSLIHYLAGEKLPGLMALEKTRNQE